MLAPDVARASIAVMPSRLAAMLTLIGLALTALVVRAESLIELAATPERWPAEVTVKAGVRGTALKNGQPAGAVLIGAGRSLALVKVAPEGLTARLGGVLVVLPAEQTDLFERVAGLPAHVAATAPAATVPVPARTAAPPVSPAASSMMQRLLADKLVRLEGDQLRSVPGVALQGVRYYALYYSASWCGPCRQFTPQLVRAYRELKAKHPQFEVVFVSADRSAADMVRYMTGDRMPFPAVGFDKRDNRIRSYAGPGIPCLVLVDEKGRVLSDSYEGDNYVGPHKVLQDLRRTLGD